MTSLSHDTIATMLHERFGHEAFRPGQERAIRALLAGRDVFGSLATGAGKSLIYQLASELLPGVTLVVSPLLALMKDQGDTLGEQGIDVSIINSARSEREIGDALARLRGGRSQLVYVTPERFRDAAFMQALRDVTVSLFVVDEAHCISEWGHSFRPAYLELGTAIAAVGAPPILALTATATPWVQRDIIERLGMHSPDVVAHGSDRANLFLGVQSVETDADEQRALRRLFVGEDEDAASATTRECGRTAGTTSDEIAALLRGSGIIYTATTRAARETAAWLAAWGIPADYYHGQRRKADRERVQEAFMAGDIRVMAATNAFGLGVDKPDVRFVIHRDVPASVEAYWQEAGRAGRDGALAYCLLLFRTADLGRAAFLGSGGAPPLDGIERVRAALLGGTRLSMRALMQATGLGRAPLARIVATLEHEQIVARRRERVGLAVADFDAAAVAAGAEGRQRAHERSRLAMMRAYAEETGCRRAYVLNYFGEVSEEGICGACDNCAAQAVDPERAATRESARDAALAAPYGLGDTVQHAAWGTGIVQRVTGDTVTILFEDAGYKMLDAKLVEERGLLALAS